MKIVTTALLTLFTLSTFAHEDLEAHKSKMNEHLDKKISRLNEAKSCSGSATTMDALKACKESLKKDMKAMKDEWEKSKAEHHKGEHKKKK